MRFRGREPAARLLGGWLLFATLAGFLALAGFAPATVAQTVPAAPAAAANASCEDVAMVQQARRTVRQQGRVVDSSLVTLPDTIPRAWRKADFSLSYQLELGVCPESSARRVILFSRIGGPYAVTEAVTEAATDAVTDAATAGGKPLEPVRQDGAAALAPYNGRIGGIFALEAQTSQINVSLLTMPNVAGGLIRVAVGPQAQVMAGPARVHYLWQQFNLVTSALMVLAGTVGLCLWLARRQDRQILWFALACLIWGARGQFLQLFSIPMAVYLYEQINPMLIWLNGLLVGASTLSSINRMNARRARGLRWLAVAAVAGFAITLVQPAAASVYRLCAFGVGFSMLAAMVVQLALGVRQLRPAHALWLAAGYCAVMIGATHDFLMIVGLSEPGWWTLLTPGFTLLLLCHMVTVGMYLMNNLNRAENSNEELEQHVANKTQELQHSYERLRDSERDAARAQERERLLRDMHDGLGAQLMTALRGVERGALAPPQVAQSLQDSLDELRLLMDSTDLSHYLPGALAAWRNRWDARLAAAGVALDWHIDDSLDSVQLSSDVVLQVMRILQEAATNIVKHSQARHMKLTASVITQPADGKPALHIDITDDGIGPQLQTVRPGARGLKNMHYRASQIGAQLSVTAREAPQSGCRVALSLELG